MSAFKEFTKRINVLGNKIRTEVGTCAYLEDAAQKFTELMYQEFSNSVVLTRLFATIPFGKLPDFNQNFVTKFADSAGVGSQLRENTPVLSLLGTQGRNNIWNDRKHSKGHTGIPLVSEDFIDSIPMMSALLKEMGISLDCLENCDTSIVVKKMGLLSGLFYVQDASDASDEKGRKIISAQNFVSNYNVKTVFGMGGSYASVRTHIVMITFINKNLPLRGAELFMKFASLFNSEMATSIWNEKIFRPENK